MSMIGKTLGNFEITSRLGKGGMGEVYQAKDQKLGRDVAIKVLPEEFAHNPERVARFQREAKVLASLNHPNIAAIHGLEEFSGTNFLVLELVEGETLADQLKRGPIWVEESLKLALQIAEALEAAHEKGVIHRDLKPANIKITPDGKVKVLDFGLAKAFASEPADLNLSNSPTLSNAATQQGVILGTAAYMSPEQARGRAVDKRTDIWAFGCVLFEMLTGQAAFQGEDTTEILASVVKSGPNLDLLPANVHPRVREMLAHCLQKDIKKRFRDIGDLQFELEQVVAGVAVWKLKQPEPRQVIRLTHNLTEDQQLTNFLTHILAVSPDGKQFAYSTSNGLFLRPMGGWDARRISSANESTLTPFFSPDGQWVGYWSQTDKKLKKVSVNEGTPIRLCDVLNVLGASWGADDTIVYVEAAKGIMRISASGGTPEMLIGAENEAFYHPRLLPDGKCVLFTLGTNEGYKIVVQSLKSGKREVLFAGDCACYLPTGHIVYALENIIYAVPFNLDTLQAGTSVQMVKDLFRYGVIYAPQYAVSDSGALVYMPKAIDAAVAGCTLMWVNRDGKEEKLKFSADSYCHPRISPDGERIALVIDKGGIGNIWIYNLVSGIPTRLTADAFSDVSPLWTPNNQRIVFASNRSENFVICSIAADGAGKVEQLLPMKSCFLSSWADKGKNLILTYVENGMDIGALPMEGDRSLKSLLHDKHNEAHPTISPNGRFIAYASDESGQFEVYVRPYPELDKKWTVSTGGGANPLWSPNGRELFYRSRESVMAASVKTDPTFKFKAPKPLFRDAYVSAGFVARGFEQHPWDIHPNGKHFLMMKEVEPKASAAVGPRKINVVLNWFEELKQKAPAK
jgi:serine/threonine protein kinase